MFKATTVAALCALTAISLSGCGHGDRKAAAASPSALPSGATPAPGTTLPAPSTPPVSLQPKNSTDQPAAAGDNGRCGEHPNPSCTGVPAGIGLRRLANNNVDHDSYQVTTAGAVLDGVHVPGNVLVKANNVVIRNSRIDGLVLGEFQGTHYTYTITNSEVGPNSGCLSAHGITDSHYVASGVYVHNISTAFQISGDGEVTIKDSYARSCSNGSDHSSNIQSFDVHNARNVLIVHNTFEERGIADFSAPVFLHDPHGTITNVSVIDNLLAGGTYSLQLKDSNGKLVVKGNQIVNNSWSFGPVESWCSAIDWSGNAIVTVDSAYKVTSTVRPLPCTS